MSISPESSAATRVGSEAIGVKIASSRLCSRSPHQFGFDRQIVLTPGWWLTRTNGPVPLAFSAAWPGAVAEAGGGFTAPVFSAQVFDRMNQVSQSAWRSGFGAFRTTSTVWSSTLTKTASAGRRTLRSEPGARTRCAENRTSSAVKSDPSWNFTPLRK